MTSNGEDAEKMEPLCHASGNGNLRSCRGKSVVAPQKVNRESPYDSATPLPGAHLEELKVGAQTNPWTPGLTAA